jgi:hypothetical protein
MPSCHGLTSGLYTYAPTKKIKYLLVLADSFRGWMEAFPTTSKRASTITTILVSKWRLPILELQKTLDLRKASNR